MAAYVTAHEAVFHRCSLELAYW